MSKRKLSFFFSLLQMGTGVGGDSVAQLWSMLFILLAMPLSFFYHSFVLSLYPLTPIHSTLQLSRQEESQTGPSIFSFFFFFFSALFIHSYQQKAITTLHTTHLTNNTLFPNGTQYYPHHSTLPLLFVACHPLPRHILFFLSFFLSHATRSQNTLTRITLPLFCPLFFSVACVPRDTLLPSSLPPLLVSFFPFPFTFASILSLFLPLPSRTATDQPPSLTSSLSFLLLFLTPSPPSLTSLRPSPG